MIKIERSNVFNFDGAIRGARNPLASWGKSDSYQSDFTEDGKDGFVIGPNDMGLLKRLIRGGSEHRKFLRQIFVSVDITAPLYWWKECDQYRINVTTDSCSTMHTIHKKKFTLDDFSHEHLTDEQVNAYYRNDSNENICIDSVSAYSWMVETVAVLNAYREKYLESNDKKYWYSMIQLLPSSYNQMRTWTGNYENLLNIYHQRNIHKLDEWRKFCEWILTLPYMGEFIGVTSDGNTEG